MKIRKLLLSCVMVFAVALVCMLALPTEANAATEGDYTYTVTNGKATITEYSGSGGDVVIPDTLGGYPVTTIGNSAFYDCVSLTSITIPDSVTTIGDWAFASCDSLAGVTIPDSVTTVGQYAFSYCDSLSYNIYDNGKYLGNETNPYVYLADTTSTSIASFNIHKDTRIIGVSAFSNCESLTSVTMGNSVTTIGENAFYDCDRLASITIGDSVTTIGDCAFYNCDSLTSITIPNSVTTIGVSAFSYCDSLTSVTIGNSVTTIDEWVFTSCDSLTNITIPDSVTTIGRSAFSCCNSLTSVTIPDSVTTIGNSAFYDCVSLTSITIPDSVTTIGDWAFASCASLTSITIPDSVTTIGQYAFYFCDSLKTAWYTGSTSDRSNISIDSYNSSLDNAKWYYNTCKDEHSYSAVCDSSCNSCQWTREAKPHDYAEATCTTSKTCKVCGDTVGSKLGHSYKTITTKATFSKNGSVVKKCSACGYVGSNVTVRYAKTFKLSTTTYSYNGNSKTPSVAVKDSAGNTLKKGTDYTVTYASGRKNAGTYKVTVKMTGKYSGTKTLTFKINKLTSAKVTAKAKTTLFAYNGKAKSLSITLKDSNGRTLKKNVDYTIKMPTGGHKVGTHTVKITLKGNYSGTETIKYTVAPTITSSIKLVKGATSSVGAKSNTSIKYSIANKSVATVSSKGVITAKKAGTTTLTVKSGTVTRKITIKVSNPSISVSASRSSVMRGKKLQLKATTNPTKAKVTWSVSDKSVASISSSGVLTGKSKGTVTVTAKFTYKGTTYSKKYKVTVKVEDPKFTIWVNDDAQVGSAAFFSFENRGSKSVKILATGRVHTGSLKYTCKKLYADRKYSTSVTVKANSEKMIAMICDSSSVYTNSKSWYYIYFEYDGERYYATCYANRYGMNKVWKWGDA